MRRSPLVVFFVIAFSITWFFQTLGLLLAQRNDLALSNEDNLLHFFALLSLRLAPGEASAYLVFTLGAGPLVASLLVSWLAHSSSVTPNLALRRICFRWASTVDSAST